MSLSLSLAAPAPRPQFLLPNTNTFHTIPYMAYTTGLRSLPYGLPYSLPYSLPYAPAGVRGVPATPSKTLYKPAALEPVAEVNAEEKAEETVEVIAKAAAAEVEGESRPYKVFEVTSYLSPSHYTAVGTEEGGPAYIARSGPVVHVVRREA